MSMTRTGMRLQRLVFLFHYFVAAAAFSIDPIPAPPTASTSSLSLSSSSSPQRTNGEFSRHRRESLAKIVSSLGFVFGMVADPTNTRCSILAPPAASAYTPDPDSLRESLYRLCRVQEATCLQERYIQKASPPIKKMKLTLRLVDRSYRLIDQINYVSKFIDPDKVVAATQAGNEAADSLQDAIDFVYGYQKDGDSMTRSQKDFLIAALTDTREKLFDFCSYLPDQAKLMEARARVEEENKLNVDEFDPDLANDAGIFNPIELPWKNRRAT
jgi:hypothetical protein